MKGFITLDYELFMGRETGTIENCLVKPMDALTKMLDKYNIKANIFVDAAYLLRLFQLKDFNKEIEKQYNIVSNHIYNLSKQGHSIQLHFHPQWLYSDYDNGWKLDFEHYKISDMQNDDILSLIPQSIELLQKYSLNKISAFRAGGYSFPMCSDVFLNILRNYNINIDTSVLRGVKKKTKYQTYDYRKIPQLSTWKFSECLCCSDNDGFFTEYPITAKKLIGWRYWLLKHELIKHYKSLKGNGGKFGDGNGIGLPSEVNKFLYNFTKLITSSTISATIDGAFSLYLEKIYNHYSNSDTFVIIGHPKNLSEKSIGLFEKFINNHKEMAFCLFD